MGTNNVPTRILDIAIFVGTFPSNMVYQEHTRMQNNIYFTSTLLIVGKLI